MPARVSVGKLRMLRLIGKVVVKVRMRFYEMHRFDSYGKTKRW